MEIKVSMQHATGDIVVHHVTTLEALGHLLLHTQGWQRAHVTVVKEPAPRQLGAAAKC